MTDSKPSDHGEGLKIITGSFYRMGTKSLGDAYSILGYNVHHGLDDIRGNPWVVMEHAAEAKWPRNGYSRPALTREEWDSAWKSFDAVTDLATPYAVDLAKAYPEAKVVIVQRDFDSWWPSFKAECLDPVFNTKTELLSIIGNLLGIRSVQAMKKTHFGFFDANNLNEIEAHAREAYDRHFKSLRDSIPPERRLEYNMSEGWGPLCEFLARPIPDVSFPRKNTRKEHDQHMDTHMKDSYFYILKRSSPWLLASATGALAAYYLMKPR
ncbi:hypothetical protein F5Y16DRAFT_122376 [Xylariaceae sp. FL0255]|nr:hypothetical protein F5Y16DRAFT_122376 [Xylariaceae sp. FL0255]